MENPETKPEGRADPVAPRWMQVVLFLSLAANLVVAGMMLGVVLKDRPPGHRDRMSDPGFGAFNQALSRPDRMALRRAFMAETGPIRLDRDDVLAEMQEVVAALRADPFDPEQLDRVMQGFGERRQSRLEVGKKLLTERLLSMTPEERTGFADRLEAALAKHPAGSKPPVEGE